MIDLNNIVALVAIAVFIGFGLGWWIRDVEAESASHGEPNENGMTGL